MGGGEEVGDPWTDAWVAGTRAGEEGEPAGFTFPTWRPEKRIDFVLYRTTTTAAGGGPGSEAAGAGAEAEAAEGKGSSCPAPPPPPALRVARVELLGREPTEDTRHLRAASMLEPGSPVWPSDHLGVYARFEML